MFYMFYEAAYSENIDPETGHYAIENKKSPKIKHHEWFDVTHRYSNLLYFDNFKSEKNEKQSTGQSRTLWSIQGWVQNSPNLRVQIPIERCYWDIFEHLKAWHRLDFYGNDLTHGDGKRIFKVLWDTLFDIGDIGYIKLVSNKLCLKHLSPTSM